MKSICLISNMTELGAGTRGASLGFQALEMGALKLGKRLFHEHDVIVIPDGNDGLYEKLTNPFGKHIEAILAAHTRAAGVICREMKAGNLPFVMSGDHSNAAASIAAVRQCFPDKRLGVVWIDAHGDLHSPYTTPSGNMHGMPLAMALGFDHAALRRNTPNASTVAVWEKLKNLGGSAPMIEPSDLVMIAVRDTEKAEDVTMENHGIRNITVEELRYRGLSACMKDVYDRLKSCELIYISFDVDSMDCHLVSRGTGTPVEHGLTPKEAETVLCDLIKDQRVVCFEMTEINPLLDEKGNEMAETAVRILDNVIRRYND